MRSERELTELERRALRLIVQLDGLTATQLGERLYGDRKMQRMPQAYARPGGKVGHALKRLNMATHEYEPRRERWVFKATRAGVAGSEVGDAPAK